MDDAEANGEEPRAEGLDDHKLQTQRYSFCVSARHLPGRELRRRSAPSRRSLVEQHAILPWFDMFDVGLTTLLLSGGSDGIHQAVTTITAFFDKTRGQ